jgi:hypothetical protein
VGRQPHQARRRRLAALRAADRAGTVAPFPRSESALISSKAVLAWLHEDADAGLLAAADQNLVRINVPWTACLGLNGDPAVQMELLRKAADERGRLIVKPAVGRAGKNVFFGSRISDRNCLHTLVCAAREAPLVLQRRVDPDLVAMPYLDQDSGKQITAEVPFVLSPFAIDGAAASVWVRHLPPGGSKGVLIGLLSALAARPASPRLWGSGHGDPAICGPSGLGAEVRITHHSKQ